MSRSLLSGMVTGLAQWNLSPLMLASLDFDSGTVRVTNLAFNIEWGGNTYIGIGAVGSIDVIAESDAGSAQGMQFTLTGVPTDRIAIALTEQYQGRRVRVWFGIVDGTGIVADPVLVFAGRMDTMPISMDATASIVVNAESRLTDFERARVRRYNHEDQIARYPGDRGFEFVPQMVEKSLYWGVANPPA
jgi:hypothetical protein